MNTLMKATFDICLESECSIFVACSIVQFIVCVYLLSAGMIDARGAGTAHIRTLWLFDNY